MILKRFVFLVIGIALFPSLFFYLASSKSLTDLLGLDRSGQEVIYWIVRIVDVVIRFLITMLITLIGVAFWKRAINPTLTFKEACAETLELLGQKQD